jgi:hypothetical protein
LRVPYSADGIGPDDVTPLYLQQKYTSFGSSTPLALGVEARLIEAEASMQVGNLAAMTVSINIVRTYYGLPAVTAPVSAAAARELLFRERAYTLWLTSHRLGDLRRLVRYYDYSQATVFPTGVYPKGEAIYGNDVNFPIPVDAEFNPSGIACIDRNP